jgi:hypothetical protein
MDLQIKKTVTQRGKTSPGSLTQESCRYNFLFLEDHLENYKVSPVEHESKAQPSTIAHLTYHNI